MYSMFKEIKVLAQLQGRYRPSPMETPKLTASPIRKSETLEETDSPTPNVSQIISQRGHPSCQNRIGATTMGTRGIGPPKIFDLWDHLYTGPPKISQ
jgi:hypothetical protein